MKQCRNCDSYVTLDFARVFGDDDDEVFGCPKCAPFSALMGGQAAMPDR